MLKCPSLPIKFSELCKKEVVNTCDGCKLGYVSDLEIDAVCGRVNALLVPKAHKLFAKCDYYVIKWEQVERIGADMILVRLPRPQPKNDDGKSCGG